MGTNQLAVSASGLSKSFAEIEAVSGLDLEIPHGEMFSLLGPNGAGKTTTIRMLCCLTRPSSGRASVMGHDIVDEPLAVKQVIAVSPQETAIAERLSARRNLRLMAGLHGMASDEAARRATELLDLMGLSDRADEGVKKFSGGMKRRLSIAMALVSQPQVLFLDEPTLGLDPQSRRAIWDYLEQLKGQMTIVLTTHYLEEADALADRIGIIDGGQLIALGTSDDLKSSIGGHNSMVVEASDLDDGALAGLRERYGNVRRIPAGVEIGSQDATLYAVQDLLRPLGVNVESTYRKQATLDDVFIELTGKQLRE